MVERYELAVSLDEILYFYNCIFHIVTSCMASVFLTVPIIAQIKKDLKCRLSVFSDDICHIM